MKYILLVFIISTAFASEKEGQDYCESYLNQRNRVQRDISELTRQMIALHAGHSEEYGPSVRTPSNCEDVPDHYSGLQHQREYLEKRLAEVNAEVARYCRRSYPE